MLDTINGLPAHPLLAHLVAVLVPVTALLAVLAVLWPAARRRIGGAALFVAVGTLVAVPLTTTAGSWLQPRVMMGGEVLQHHATLGGQLLIWSALLTVAMIVWWALHTPLFTAEVGTLSPTVRRIGVALSGAGTLVFAAVSTWLVVRIGHTGAQSMWGGMSC
ncbi:hypothetical protein [[Mycobacterium] crassicus]|uniref:Uncharacterized protein n=1 Tax=[Mycobacterium] crassicus TaxID=2872309 RepID=A0ABU5XFA0_9MYCO|nr:hypothetical protein [Mycolicibacter sp. MYC098]MEB3019811.1 hypothetical protein [Mycolicibacter sp. MYC098]